MKLPSVYFPNPIPKVDPLDKLSHQNLPTFVVEAPFSAYINGIKWVIPAGFETDFQSIPFGFRNTFPPNHPRCLGPSLLHDDLYHGEFCSRLFADKVFLSAMIFRGVSAWERNVKFGAVAAFGWSTYKLHTLDTIMELRALHGIISTKRPLWREIGVWK